jgi:hypothetical protein
MSRNGVGGCETGPVYIEGDTRQGQSVNDLTVRFHGQIRAEDIPDGVIEDPAVLAVKYHI